MGLVFSLEGDRADVAVHKKFARQFFRLLADENVRVKLFGRALESRGKVHAVAKDGELHALGMTDVADDDVAVVHANADL